jgi:hypothetical protein
MNFQEQFYNVYGALYEIHPHRFHFSHVQLQLLRVTSPVFQQPRPNRSLYLEIFDPRPQVENEVTRHTSAVIQLLRCFSDLGGNPADRDWYQGS